MGLDFEGIAFEGDAIFYNAVFFAQGDASSLDFSEVEFRQLAAFNRAHFYADTVVFASGKPNDPKASFLGDVQMGAIFGGEASGIHYKGDTYFSGIEFPKKAEFWVATFHGEVHFETVTFHGPADFEEATFFGHAYFREGTTFLSEANFSDAKCVEGGSAGFSEARFEGVATFDGAILDDVSFEQASFKGIRAIATTFGSVEFTQTTFDEGEVLEGSRLMAANFEGSSFRIAEFMEARFYGDVYFVGAAFEDEASFTGAIFTGEVDFLGYDATDHLRTKTNRVFRPQTRVDLGGIRVDQPERLTFHTVLLRPGWFVNADARDFTFVNVDWYGLSDGSRATLDDELKILQERNVPSALNLLSKTCRELSINAEENRDYSAASSFNYWTWDAQRKKSRASSFAPWRLVWWYWLLSGYGERHVRASLVLGAMLIIFAGLYLLTGFIEWPQPSPVCKPSPADYAGAFWEALVYSLGAMTRLIPKVPQTETVLLRSLVLIEGILGPLQIGLLALAIRRKFMR